MKKPLLILGFLACCSCSDTNQSKPLQDSESYTNSVEKQKENLQTEINLNFSPSLFSSRAIIKVEADVMPKTLENVGVPAIQITSFPIQDLEKNRRISFQIPSHFTGKFLIQVSGLAADDCNQALQGILVDPKVTSSVSFEDNKFVSTVMACLPPSGTEF